MTLKEQYKHELELLKGRIHKLKGRGYIYDYSITEHKKPTISTIRYIRSLRGEKLTQGVHSKNIDISVLAVGKENVPTRAEQKEAGISFSEYKQMLESGVASYELQDITYNRIEFENVMEDISVPEPTITVPKVDTFDYSSIAPLSYDLSEEPTLDSAPKAEDLEKGVYYVDEYTGRMFSPEDDRIYMHDNQGRLILDDEGNKILKSTMLLKTNETMSKQEYEEVLWESVTSRYYYPGAGNSHSFVNWLNEKRAEYGTFKVVNALREYEKDGQYRLDYHFFYTASEADMAAVRQSLYQILMKYERKVLTNKEKQDIVDQMDDLERQEWWEEPD